MASYILLLNFFIACLECSTSWKYLSLKLEAMEKVTSIFTVCLSSLVVCKCLILVTIQQVFFRPIVTPHYTISKVIIAHLYLYGRSLDTNNSICFGCDSYLDNGYVLYR